MSKSATFFIFAIIPLFVEGSLVPPEGSVCLLKDPENQCGSFCMSVVKPMVNHIAKHQDQWSTSDALGLNETQAKLERIEGQQASLEKAVRAAMPAQDIATRLNRMADQQEILVSNGKETLNKLERILSQDLLAKLDRMETLWQQKLSCAQNPKESKNIPPDFQKIGSRFFYIERSTKLNWFAASDKCRRMGGQLAIIEDEVERRAVAAKVNSTYDVGFWLDIHNLANKFEYTSSATGRIPFIKWGSNQPNKGDEECVAMDNGEMHDYSCASKLFFICQA
ncbi:accessory gland protein Acp29AB-like [Drosophila kikkawai]|uniref:Accessory gland protein Acp29AB-like n=1 Tax=Drosophila kikkawai TaxID=30033 RepID=A0A6P4I8V5_DROKI|nr:accessory gland protein Acp29AB-like [Drosophila kikkawai]KAH8308161.1 hypothetical protein KR059_007299 [Drosophila kikkawai]